MVLTLRSFLILAEFSHRNGGILRKKRKNSATAKWLAATSGQISRCRHFVYLRYARLAEIVQHYATFDHCYFSKFHFFSLHTTADAQDEVDEPCPSHEAIRRKRVNDKTRKQTKTLTRNKRGRK